MNTILNEGDLKGYTAPVNRPGWQRVLDSHKALLKEYGRVVGRVYALEVVLQEHGIDINSLIMVSWAPPPNPPDESYLTRWGETLRCIIYRTDGTMQEWWLSDGGKTWTLEREYHGSSVP